MTQILALWDQGPEAGDMLPGRTDSRLLLLVLAAEGVELTGAALARLWQRYSPQGRLSQRLRELESSGQIERSGGGRIDRRVFRITAAGRKQSLGVVDPTPLWQRPWDGQWRLVLFDIPEHKSRLRTRLRRHLRESRFGWLQNSVWISPDPPDELFTRTDDASLAADSLSVLEARPIGGESDADLVAAAWNFRRIGEDYKSYRKLLRAQPAPSAGLKSWSRWIEVEQNGWRAISKRDPFLPEKLLPPDYAGQEAWGERVEAYQQAGLALRKLAAT